MGRISRGQGFLNVYILFRSKHFSILVLAPLYSYLVPYLHQFSAIVYVSAENLLFKVLVGTNLAS